MVQLHKYIEGLRQDIERDNAEEIEDALHDGYYFSPLTTYRLWHEEYRLRVTGVSHLKARDAILKHGWSFGGNPSEMLHRIKPSQMPDMKNKDLPTISYEELKPQLLPATRHGTSLSNNSALLNSPCGELVVCCYSHEEVYDLLVKGWTFDSTQVYVHSPSRLVHCNNYGRTKAKDAILNHGWRWGVSEIPTKRIEPREMQSVLDGRTTTQKQSASGWDPKLLDKLLG